MESRIQYIFLKHGVETPSSTATLPAALMWLVVMLLALPTGVSYAATPDEIELEPLMVRENERREVNIDDLDSEDFEIGISGGIMHFEDFGSDTSTSLRIAYHITEDFFVEGVYGQSRLGQTSFEQLSGGSPLLTEEERDVTYYNMSLGWNIFPGEAFVGGRWAFKGDLYLIAGAGSTEFGGDELFTINAGVGYRLIATDWMAIHVDVRDHYFESDLLGTMEAKHNIEFSGGVTFFF